MKPLTPAEVDAMERVAGLMIAPTREDGLRLIATVRAAWDQGQASEYAEMDRLRAALAAAHEETSVFRVDAQNFAEAADKATAECERLRADVERLTRQSDALERALRRTGR